MNKRKLRRVAIVALVLVLLCNTLGVQAETGAPAVTVSSYEELVNAIDQASNLDTILIEAVIWIPEGASLGDSSKTVILKSSGGYMEIVENTQSEEITSFTGLIFDGAGKELLAPYLRITAPLNVQVRLRAYCMIWELKQKYYKADTPLPYVSKASHKADEDKIKSLEARIIKGGSDEERAVKAVAEAKEYLEIVAGSRVRDNTKNRVF